MLTWQHTVPSTCSLTGHVWFHMRPPQSANHLSHVPFPAGFPFRSVLWKHGQEIRKQEEERFLLWAAQLRALLTAAGRGHRGRRDGLSAAVCPGVCSSERGRTSRESCRCGLRGSDCGHKQIPRLCTSLTPSVALPWRPLLSPLYFSSPYVSFASNPLYLKYLARLCLSEWTLPNTLLLALTTPNDIFGVEVLTQTMLISLLHPTSSLDIGKEPHILVSLNTCYNT